LIVIHDFSYHKGTITGQTSPNTTIKQPLQRQRRQSKKATASKSMSTIERDRIHQSWKFQVIVQRAGASLHYVTSDQKLMHPAGHFVWHFQCVLSCCLQKSISSTSMTCFLFWDWYSEQWNVLNKWSIFTWWVE